MHSVDVKPPKRPLKEAEIIYPPKKKPYCKMTQPTQYGTAQCNGAYLEKVTLLEA